jgi:hypothetical protein
MVLWQKKYLRKKQKHQKQKSEGGPGRTRIMVLKLLTIITLACSMECSTIEVTPQAAAIAACESGNTKTLGSVSWRASNFNDNGTVDTGAFQFNSYWMWNLEKPWMLKKAFGEQWEDVIWEYRSAGSAPEHIQYEMFRSVWNDGKGWKHWKASQKCWSQWMYINSDGIATWRD